jgi:hypothetical protein
MVPLASTTPQTKILDVLVVTLTPCSLHSLMYDGERVPRFILYIIKAFKMYCYRGVTHINVLIHSSNGGDVSPAAEGEYTGEGLHPITTDGLREVLTMTNDIALQVDMHPELDEAINMIPREWARSEGDFITRIVHVGEFKLFSNDSVISGMLDEEAIHPYVSSLCVLLDDNPRFRYEVMRMDFDPNPVSDCCKGLGGIETERVLTTNNIWKRLNGYTVLDVATEAITFTPNVVPSMGHVEFNGRMFSLLQEHRFVERVSTLISLIHDNLIMNFLKMVTYSFSCLMRCKGVPHTAGKEASLALFQQYINVVKLYTSQNGTVERRHVVEIFMENIIDMVFYEDINIDEHYVISYKEPINTLSIEDMELVMTML